MVVTVGFFDGVHLGHKKVLRHLTESGEPSVVVTVWPHPRVVLQQGARDLYLLNTLEEKERLIHSYGIERIECLKFDTDFANMTAERFVNEKLVGELGCTHLVLGYDNRLGSDGLETEDVAALCRKTGLKVDIVAPCMYEDGSISSTRIRRCLMEGDVTAAADMLGYRYPLEGIVVAGNRLGRTIGFPTANIKPAFPLKMIPVNGVYATEVIVDGKRYRGMTNIGVRPTLGDGNERLIETNIFDFDQEIYGMEIRINFIAKIRSEQRFSSLEELKAQLEIDKHRCYGFN